MKKMSLLSVLSMIFILNGCGSDSRSESVAVSAKGDGQVTSITTDGKTKVVSGAVEVDPDETQVRLWLTSNGIFVFDNELVDSRRGTKGFCSSEYPVDCNHRYTIQDIIHKRLPDYMITHIERTKEEMPHFFHEWSTVYYVSLKKNHR